MGILISNNGTFTLPCLLFIIAIPLIAIGHYRCNNERDIFICYNNYKLLRYNDDTSLSSSSSVINYYHNYNAKNASSDLNQGQLYHFQSILYLIWNQPHQLNLGFLLLLLGIINVSIEMDLFQNYFKIIMKTMIANNNNDNDRKNEYDIDIEIMARQYTHEEIKNEIDTLIQQSIQQQYSEHDHKTKERLVLQKKIISCLHSLSFQIDIIKKKRKNNDKDDKETNQLYLTSQEVSYATLRMCSNKNKKQDYDEVISASLSLLALGAKNDSVRCRHLQKDNNESYHLSLPINNMKSSLERSKCCVSSDEYEETKEQLAADIQRKGCIYLGALSDGNSDIASHITQCGGLENILNSIDWFRYHSHVVNWALWAIFNICFDHVRNKGEFIRLDGIRKVCLAMKNVLCDDDNENDNGNKEEEEIKDQLEVSRHGVAILFDLLRFDASSIQHKSDNQILLNVMNARKIALNAGLHEVLIISMTKFPKDTQIMMMGQQILLATGYIGDIPSFQGSLVCAH